MRRRSGIGIIVLPTLILALGSAVALYFSHAWSDIGRTNLTEPKRLRMAALYTGDNQNFIEELGGGLKTAAEEEDIWVSFEAFGSGDTASHLEAFACAIDSGVDGIITNIPNDSEIGRLIDRAALEGIPVATIVDDFYGSQRKVHIGVDYQKFGWQAAESLQKQRPNGARTAIITYPLEKQTRECLKKISGFVERVRSYGEYYVGVENVQALNYVSAYNLAHDLLTSSFGYDSFFCIDETLTAAVAKCLKDMGKEDIAVVGCGESQAFYEYLADGVLDVVLIENAYWVGHSAVVELADSIENGGLPHIIETDIQVVTVENLEECFRDEAGS